VRVGTRKKGQAGRRSLRVPVLVASIGSCDVENCCIVRCGEVEVKQPSQVEPLELSRALPFSFLVCSRWMAVFRKTLAIINISCAVVNENVRRREERRKAREASKLSFPSSRKALYNRIPLCARSSL
jgi:hypothetical protein